MKQTDSKLAGGIPARQLNVMCASENTGKSLYKDEITCYDDIVAVTQNVAKDRGIFWEEEQAEICWDILKHYCS